VFITALNNVTRVLLTLECSWCLSFYQVIRLSETLQRIVGKVSTDVYLPNSVIGTFIHAVIAYDMHFNLSMHLALVY